MLKRKALMESIAVLVMISLGWLLEAHPNICYRLVSLSQPLPNNPDFLSYRLLCGLTEAINTCFWFKRICYGEA
ncbi:hypothetical protein ACFL3Q_11840 [Planctomycetota bacterium]